MEDNQPFFIDRQPFLFKIKGGPKLPDLTVTNEDLSRLAEVYTRGPDSTQEATWRKYRHCKELSDIMDVLLPKIRLFNQPPYGMYGVNGSLENWKSLRDNAKNWKKKEGPGSLTQLRNDALAEEQDDGQPYVSDGSQDSAQEKEGHVEDPIIVSNQSKPSGEDRLRKRRCRASGLPETGDLRARRVASAPNSKKHPRIGKTREAEQKLMNQPKQLLSPSESYKDCAKARAKCYVEDARIRALNDTSVGRKKLLKCIRCVVYQRVCGLEEKIREELLKRLEKP
ncbi:uncharacterized protein EV420DRAFT_104161 [Desarmillaria tabescens]|uniref:Uncharacterized protein n=1 Tax=Armillaria tabescens TaxID=1929756 RepID=A0AA39NR32_ARMTA|nr:uncharacterized protein EV420DRAFT_104161 [Desarmillaria tabescens]KAK0470297.1 hypothetical protein EV420DRAFT_104161 [Desarmillaria tabescens]